MTDACRCQRFIASCLMWINPYQTRWLYRAKPQKSTIFTEFFDSFSRAWGAAARALFPLPEGGGDAALLLAQNRPHMPHGQRDHGLDPHGGGVDHDGVRGDGHGGVLAAHIAGVADLHIL